MVYLWMDKDGSNGPAQNAAFRETHLKCASGRKKCVIVDGVFNHWHIWHVSVSWYGASSAEATRGPSACRCGAK